MRDNNQTNDLAVPVNHSFDELMHGKITGKKAERLSEQLPEGCGVTISRTETKTNRFTLFSKSKAKTTVTETKAYIDSDGYTINKEKRKQ